MKSKKAIITIFIIILTTFSIMHTVKSTNIMVHNAEMLEKVKKLQNFAEEYIKQNNITEYTATDLCMQYIRKDRYNSTLWNVLLGDIDTGFINFLSEKENVATFKNDVLLDPITGKEIDFVHMIAPLNAYIENGDTVIQLISTHYSGWAGDLITLLEEVTVYRTENNIQDKNVLQEYSNSLLGTNNPSTCPSSDILADLDAIALYNDSSNGIKSNLYNALYKYYVSTDSAYNATNRLSSAKKILGNSKSNVKANAKELLTNTDLLIIDIKESFFQDSSMVAKVTANDIDVVSQSFANYVYGEPYLELKESNGIGTVEEVIDVKIIESNVNLKNANIEIENTKIAKAEIYKENLRITPLEAGKTNITVYSEDKTVSSTFELTSKNVAPNITGNLEEMYELTVDEEKNFYIQADGTNNVYTWYIKKQTDEEFKKVAESNDNRYKLLPTLEMNNAYIKCGVKNNGNDEIFSILAKLVVKESCKHTYIMKQDATQHWEECAECGEVKEESLEAHNYTKCVDNGDGTHTKTCSNCNYKYTKNHKEDCQECKKVMLPNDDKATKDPTITDKEIPNAGVQRAITRIATALIVILGITVIKMRKDKDI